MATRDLIMKAPRDRTGYLGAAWVRAALQVNPFDYKGSAAPSNSFPDEETYNRELVAACVDLGVGMIGITDHWCADSGVELSALAEAAGIAALLGFEAHSAEGVHLLVLFERGTPIGHLNAAIGECGVTAGCHSRETGKSYEDILTAMSRRGALVIPAHVNGPKGLLTNQVGVVLERRLKHSDLFGLAICCDLPDTREQQAILAANPPFDRQQPLAEIYADDVCSPAAVGARGATSWFKISVPSLAALKVAVRTPATRVRLEDPSSAQRPLIRSIRWEGGLLDDVEIVLAPDLTTLIGGRGTGKSTVVETLRYAFGLRPFGVKAQRDHDELVQNGLGAAGKISVEVSVESPSHATYFIERSSNQTPVVLNSSRLATGL